MIQARDIMTKGVAGIHPKATVGQAMDLMARLDFSSLPVIDVSGIIVGILTARDVVRRVAGYEPRQPRTGDSILLDGFCKGGTKADRQLVEDVMTPELCTVQETASVTEVARLIRERGIKRLPVLRGDKIVGMIHRRALAAALGTDFATEADNPFGPETPRDCVIKDAVHAALKELKWTPAPLIEVTVEGGDVTLRGTLLQEDERAPLRAAIETIPGVARYMDNLALADAAEDIFPSKTEEMMRRQKLF